MITTPIEETLHAPENIQAHFQAQGLGDPIVREALGVVAKANGLPVERVQQLFFTRDAVVADMVRALINLRYPDRFEQLSYCPICQKFSLIEIKEN
jgi:hypothetical protein